MLYAARPLFGSIASKGLTSVSKAGFGVKKGGYEDRLSAKKKAQEALNKRIGSIDESKYVGRPEELKAARAFAKEMQANYRQNLPWKNSVLAKLLDNRGNRQTAHKLTEEADKKTKKDNKKASEGKLKENKKKLKDLEQKAARLEEPQMLAVGGRLGADMEANKRTALREIAEEKKRLEEENEKHEEAIEEGKKIEEEEKEAKRDSKIDDLKEKIDSSGGGGGAEKKDDKK
jgi:hypothetical protein